MADNALTTPDQAPISNPTVDIQMAHRTIRSFVDKPLSPEQITTLFEVARHTSSCSFAQQFTLIHVTESAIRHQVYLASGQPYVGGSKGELFVFVLDLYRNSKIREEAGKDLEPMGRTNVFFAGFYDAILAAQNVMVAAESMGLGAVFLASINADPRRVIQALKLPKYTFPVLGMVVGYPDQEPQFKPRLPLAVITAENVYPEVDSYSETLAEYDQVVQHYYDLRDANNRIDSFTNQIAHKLGTGAADTSPMLEILKEQGFFVQ